MSTDTDQASSDDFQVLGSPTPRTDAGGAVKRRGRPPKVRHDSAVDTALDGWGSPLEVRGEVGFRYFWVSENDLGRFNRPWVKCLWGVDRVKVSDTVEGHKGTDIKFRELRLYKMREADALNIEARDANRRRHAQLKSAAQSLAEGSGGHMHVKNHEMQM